MATIGAGGGVLQTEPYAFTSRRSPVLSLNAMCSSSQPLATEAGLCIMRRGGNAVECAVVMASCLAVLEPNSTGVGGDFFALVYSPPSASGSASSRVEAINGSGKASHEVDIAQVRADLGLAADYRGDFPDTIPAFQSAHTVTVPGCVSAWLDALDKWGSEKFSLAEIFGPAIDMARNGFPVAPITAHHWSAEYLRKAGSNNVHEMLVRDDSETLRAPKAGEIFRRHEFANVLENIVALGKKGFYEGWVAEAIVEEVRSHGGAMSLKDLREHQTTFSEAIKTEYFGVEVWEHPPNGDGLICLMALNILSALEEQGLVAFEKGNSSEKMEKKTDSQLHAIVESLRLAYADGRRFIGDPDATDWRALSAKLLSKDWAESRARLVQRDKRGEDPLFFAGPTQSSDTVAFNCVDQWGRSVSAVNSNYMGFGTGLVPRGCGFTLQNRAHNFRLEEGHPNCLRGGHRPFHTIIPCIITRTDGRLFATLTNMGGFMQPQAHVQHVINLVRFGVDPQRSVDAPRIRVSHDEDGPEDALCFVEPGFSDEAIEGLGRRGHIVQVVTGQERANFGRAQIIVRTEDGVLWGGSDGRADGCAMGF